MHSMLHSAGRLEGWEGRNAGKPGRILGNKGMTWAFRGAEGFKAAMDFWTCLPSVLAFEPCSAIHPDSAADASLDGCDDYAGVLRGADKRGLIL